MVGDWGQLEKCVLISLMLQLFSYSYSMKIVIQNIFTRICYTIFTIRPFNISIFAHFSLLFHFFSLSFVWFDVASGFLNNNAYWHISGTSFIFYIYIHSVHCTFIWNVWFLFLYLVHNLETKQSHSVALFRFRNI